MPKTVEISEEDFLRDSKLRSRVAALLAHPEAALLVEKANKLVDPNAPTPVTDRTKVVTEPVEAIRKEFDDYKAKQAKDQADRDEAMKRQQLHSNVEEGLARLRRAGWTDEGIKGVEKIMEDKGILDPEIAAAYFEKQHPPQTPVKPGGTGAWNFPDIPTEGAGYEKSLLDSKGQNDVIVERQAFETLQELRGASRR